MSQTLNLGVILQPYNNPPSKRNRKRAAAVKSTGDVAEFLESRYGVMQAFYDAHQPEIADALANDVAGSLETLMMGGKTELTFATATSTIETMFKKAISNKEFDRMGIPGVPTQASLRGVNHRLAHPYAKRGPRPSFLDTSLYSSSFKAWFER